MDAQHVWVLDGKDGQSACYILSEWPDTAGENWVLQMMDSPRQSNSKDKGVLEIKGVS